MVSWITDNKDLIMINAILNSLGFSEEEVECYIALLELGSSTAGMLAKKMGVPRPTLYGTLRKLQDKGLLTQSMNEAGIKTFAALEPQKINQLFEQRKEQLDRNQNLFKQALPDLMKKQPSKLLKPNFQLFEGEEGVKHVLKDMLLYSNMETMAFWPIKAMVEILSPDFFRYHNKERIKNNLYTRAIWPQHQLVDIAEHPFLGVGGDFRREIRVAPAEIDFTMGYWIYGNKVAYISSRNESFGFILESAEHVEMLKTQFEMLWKLSEPLKVDGKVTQPFIEELKRYN